MLNLEYFVNRDAWLVETDCESSFTGNQIFVRNDDLFEKIVEPFGTASIHKDMWEELRKEIKETISEVSVLRDMDSTLYNRAFSSVLEKMKEIENKNGGNE